MLDWLKRLTTHPPPPQPPNRAAQQGLGMSRPYFALHEYLNARVTDVVVMSFRDIEDLVGFSLPVSARRDARWWEDADLGNASHANAWLLARRSATADLDTQTVEFSRGLRTPRAERA